MIKIRLYTYLSILILSLIIGTGCDRAEYSSSNYTVQKVQGVSNLVPVCIIGSGPAGLSAALYAGRSNMHTLVISGPKPGGALTETSEVENWPAIPHVQGPDAVALLRTQAQEFGATIMTDTVTSLDTSIWPFVVTTEHGHRLRVLALIIATGSAPLTLGVKGEQEYWGKGVTTCAICDAPYHKDSSVVVVGGGDSAAEEALQLARYAKEVTVLVRKDAMRASARMQERLKTYPNIVVRYNTHVQEIVGTPDKVTGVIIVDSVTGQKEQKEVSGVFLAIGHLPNTSLFKELVQLTDSGHIKMQGRTQQTSVEGIFAAGDVEDARYKQAGSAAGHGINAALDAVSWLEEHGFSPLVMKELEPQFFKLKKVALGAVPQLTRIEELESLLAEEKGVVLVDFYAPYCPSCMHMLPLYQEVAAEYEGRVTFVKVDTSESKDIAESLRVHSVPTVMGFKGGALAARYNKALSKRQIIDLIERLTKGK
jgi:thioredoxin reductase (NADPH)